jgi:carboxymethylenebutenolidase
MRPFNTELSFVVLLVAVLVGCAPDAGEGTADAAGEDFVARMAIEHAEDEPVASETAAVDPASEVATESVAYATIDGQPIAGYLARPRGGSGSLPGIVVIHEWWGLNDNIRAMAERLAGEGYAALAVDLYEGEAAESPQRARELVGATLERASALQDNLSQAISYLQEDVGVSGVGTIGWCFGGGWSLNAALDNPERVDATVIYYGRLVTDPERLRVLQTPILGIFGDEDTGIPVETVREFESALTDLDMPAEVHIYEGAHHAFANPSGTRYNAEAAEDAWQKTVAFFQDRLR